MGHIREVAPFSMLSDDKSRLLNATPAIRPIPKIKPRSLCHLSSVILALVLMTLKSKVGQGEWREKGKLVISVH